MMLMLKSQKKIGGDFGGFLSGKAEASAHRSRQAGDPAQGWNGLVHHHSPSTRSSPCKRCFWSCGQDDPVLKYVRELLAAVKIPLQKQAGGTPKAGCSPVQSPFLIRSSRQAFPKLHPPNCKPKKPQAVGWHARAEAGP